MTPKIAFMHLCEQAYFDEKQQLCLIGIFDTLTTDGFPVKAERMALAGRLRGRPNAMIPVTLFAMTEDGDGIVEARGQIATGPNGDGGFVFEISHAQFPGPGRYAIAIYDAAENPMGPPIFLIVRSTSPSATPAALH
jgi:hypothetical protein